MEKQIVKEIIGWDIINWSKAIEYWEKNISIKNRNYKCLELGAANGGLSLWLALNKNNVLCSDIGEPEDEARVMHEKYNCNSNIEYAAIDATNIPFENHFDIVVFKSILGGISEKKRDEYKVITLNEIHKALKPGGMLLFAENMEATPFHKFLRRKYGTPHWNYIKMDEILEIFKSFENVNYTTVGFLGCFGRNEMQRNILGKIDCMIEKLIPKRNRYILIGIAVK